MVRYSETDSEDVKKLLRYSLWMNLGTAGVIFVATILGLYYLTFAPMTNWKLYSFCAAIGITCVTCGLSIHGFFKKFRRGSAEVEKQVKLSLEAQAILDDKNLHPK